MRRGTFGEIIHVLIEEGLIRNRSPIRRKMVRLLNRNSRRIGLFLLPMLATPVLAGGVAFHRHPLLTMRQMLRCRLLLSGASERTVDVRGLPVRYFESK